MFHDDFTRQFLLASAGLTFLAFSVWAAAWPQPLARFLGYRLTTPNGQSEFHAIYVGIFAAQAALCGLAGMRVGDAALGDLAALFLLAQVAGRLLAAARHGFPSVTHRVLLALESCGGLALLAVRPGV